MAAVILAACQQVLGASADGFECLRLGSNGVYAAPAADLIRGYGEELEPSEALLRLRELGALSWLAALSAARPELVSEVLRRMRYWRGEENAPVWQPV
jgi:hypothetical protein